MTESERDGAGRSLPKGLRALSVSRRDFLKAGASFGVAAPVLSSGQGRLIDNLLTSSSSGPASLRDVKHVVILMQENRSFDHYFGTMPGVRGFGDTATYSSYAHGPRSGGPGVLTQSMAGTSMGGTPVHYALSGGATVLQPFELVSNPPTVAGQTTNDITHDWGPQHGAWNNGAMDRWVIEHLANDPISQYQLTDSAGLPIPGSSSVPIGPLTMGYYRQRDSLDFYRALADAFTICDRYHCSVLGPTDPNRLMWMSGSLGAHSADSGGPILETYVTNKEELVGSLNWPTMPELLTEHGVSWKIYQDPSATAFFNVIDYFKNFAAPSTTTQATNAANALTPQYPAGFAADVAAGTLPQVSWILPLLPCCEHPSTPPEYGEWLVSQILSTLVGNPEVWQQTVFLVVYDENGGFFDHVAPPTPGPTVTSLAGVPTSAAFDGEYVTTATPSNAAGGPPSDWYGVLGPVGLGFRVPAMVISPFSAGGWVCPDTFDHVSTLKFIESVFLPSGTLMGSGWLHISPWRYGTVGDLTAALPNLAAAVGTVPALPATSLLFPEVAEQAFVNSVTGVEDDAQAYPLPAANSGVPGPDPDPLRTRRRTRT
jgi:phospholipase C